MFLQEAQDFTSMSILACYGDSGIGSDFLHLRTSVAQLGDEHPSSFGCSRQQNALTGERESVLASIFQQSIHDTFSNKGFRDKIGREAVAGQSGRSSRANRCYADMLQCLWIVAKGTQAIHADGDAIGAGK